MYSSKQHKRLPAFAAACLLSCSFANAVAKEGIRDEYPLPPLPMQESATPALTVAQAQTMQAPNKATAVKKTKTVQAAPPAQPKKKKTSRAFNSLKQKNFPLTPEEIKELHRILDDSQRAVAAPAGIPPTPVSSSQSVSLAPGVTPPVIRLSAGFITTMVFVDSTGAPWPITAYGIGNPSTFNIQWDNKSNVLMVQSLVSHATGNMAVRLKGLPTPITITLVTAQKEVDYRVDLQVSGRGPNAITAITTGTEQMMSQNSQQMINLLDGVPPRDSRKLRVQGDSGKAWVSNNQLYYRTKLTVLSPAWTNTVSSPDGTKVYALAPTPLILASKDGQTIKIRLSGY